MAGHYCNEHQTPYFKTKKMRGYAHPIKDEAGEDTGDWCNEPKSEAAETPPDNEMSKEDWDGRDLRTRYSIEGQKAADLTSELWIADKLKDNDIRVEALLSWLLLAIKKNMPDKVEVIVEPKDYTQTPPGKPLNAEDIKTLLNNAGVTQKQASDMLVEKFKVAKKPSVMDMIKGLDKVQMKWFLDSITENLGIPPDYPF